MHMGGICTCLFPHSSPVMKPTVTSSGSREPLHDSAKARPPLYAQREEEEEEEEEEIEQREALVNTLHTFTYGRIMFTCLQIYLS